MARRAVKLGDVVEALESIAPTRRSEQWDNVGLLAGDLKTEVRRVLMCIDLMPAVVSEAVRGKHQLVVSYHPPIFRPITRLVEPSRGMEAGLHRCIRNGIAVFTPHTALDVAKGGTNDVLAAACGVKSPLPLPREDEVPEHGIGRMGAIVPTKLVDLARKLKRRTGARCVSMVGKPERRVRRAIVCVGSAGSLVFDAGLRNGDVVITGEIRHHDALSILRSGAGAIAFASARWSRVSR